MLYRLEYTSYWTAYTVDFYDSVKTCEKDCERRYEIEGVRFTWSDKEGCLVADISGEDEVILKLHETNENEVVF